MNAKEAAQLCRYVAACCPQQAINADTPVAWADLLDDIDLAEAKAAARTVVRRQPFCAPAEIRAEVKRTRTKRIADHPPLTPPPGLTNAQERAWLADATRRIGNGETIDTTHGQITATRPALRALVAAATPRTAA